MNTTSKVECSNDTTYLVKVFKKHVKSDFEFVKSILKELFLIVEKKIEEEN